MTPMVRRQNRSMPSAPPPAAWGAALSLRLSPRRRRSLSRHFHRHTVGCHLTIVDAIAGKGEVYLDSLYSEWGRNESVLALKEALADLGKVQFVEMSYDGSMAAFLVAANPRFEDVLQVHGALAVTPDG
jgi:hypothetical protein